MRRAVARHRGTRSAQRTACSAPTTAALEARNSATSCRRSTWLARSRARSEAHDDDPVVREDEAAGGGGAVRDARVVEPLQQRPCLAQSGAILRWERAQIASVDPAPHEHALAVADPMGPRHLGCRHTVSSREHQCQGLVLDRTVGVPDVVGLDGIAERRQPPQPIQPVRVTPVPIRDTNVQGRRRRRCRHERSRSSDRPARSRRSRGLRRPSRVASTRGSGSPRGAPNTRWMAEPTTQPTAKPPRTSAGKWAPTYRRATATSATSSHVVRRAERPRYGLATVAIAAATAT